MAKTKSPFLSFAAQGSVGDTLTAQKRGADTILRRKPLPSDPYSLAQAYQRWLYTDYAYLWRQQSIATRQEYATAGSRHHLTGFQYWMKYQLKNLPDIVGWWKLDDNLGATTQDSSRNANNAAIIGASPATGVIGECLSFDGLNDSVRFFHSPSLAVQTNFSIEAFFQPLELAWFHGLFSHILPGSSQLFVDVNNVNQFEFRFRVGGVWGGLLTSNGVVALGSFFHIVATYDGTWMSLYFNGAFDKRQAQAGLVDSDDYPWVIGDTVIPPVRPAHALIDNVIFYNRVLDPTEILRHSERSYSA